MTDKLNNKKVTIMKDKKKWLVTVQGYDYYYSPPTVIISKVIILPDTETPVEWFLKEPTVYSRFEFKPNALLNFWEITPNNNKGAVYPTECPNKCEMTTFEITTEHIWKCTQCSRIIDLRVENNYDW